MSKGVKTIFRNLFTIALLVGGVFYGLVAPTAPVNAVVGTNEQLNFQGRLFNAQGATVPDGNYNIQFKIYQDGDGLSVGNTTGSPAGSLKWTESHLNSTSSGVQVKNGYMSVDLGSVTAFGSSVDWNQSVLWLSINIGNTNGSCTPFTSCAPDGEMVPMKRLSSTPYSLNSGRLGGLTSTQFLQLAQGVQTDASTNTTSIFLNKTGGGDFLGLQSSGVNVFNLTNSGDLSFGANADHSISIATAAASTAGKSLTVGPGTGGSGTGSAGGNLVLQGGTAGGTNANGGNVTINAGAKTGSGTDGAIALGTSNTSAINLNQNTTVAAGKSLAVTGGVTGTRPASPTEGMIYFDTTTKRLLTYANGKWQADSKEAVIVAASNSSQAEKDAADYVGDGNTGAAADGDQVQINAALTAASGKKVILLAGTYVADATILIPNNTVMAGVGNGTVVELADLDATDNLIENTDQSTGTGIVISDLMLDGRNDLNTAGTQYGIYLNNMGSASNSRNGATIRSVHTKRFRTVNVYLNASENGRITESVMADASSAVELNNSNNNAFANNSVMGMGVVGFKLTGSDRNSFDTNILTTTFYGFDLASGADSNTITGNRYTPSGTASYGVKVNGSSNNIVSNNYLSTPRYGVSITTSPGTVVSGNTMNGGSFYGIEVISNDVAVTGNTITTYSLRGIMVNGNNNTITGNRVADNGGSTTNNGIYLTAADSNAITSNIISDTSATTDNYAINVFDSTSDTNYLASNTLGTGSINNTGTGTIFGGQVSSAGNYQVQPAGTIELMKNTNITGDLSVNNVSLNAGANRSITVATAAASTAGHQLTMGAGTGGSGAGSVGGDLVLQGGTAGGTNANGGSVAIDAGAKTGSGIDGSINIGTARASTIQIGSTTLATGTQTINLGTNNTAGSTTNVTIGSGSTATGGTTNLQAKTSIALSTNGVARASLDNAGSIYFGNGVTAAAPSNFTVRGTGSSTTAVAGGTLTVQGGNATVGNANGGNLTLSGGTGFGTGVSGLVVIATPTFSTTANDANCYTAGALVAASCTIAAASVNNSSAILVGFNQGLQTATLPDPTTLTAGRVVYITAANGSSDFTLSVNGGGTGNQIAMRQNTTATMIWNGADWTAAGASSSTTLQSAYDNTLQSAGGAELVVSKTANTNGLTIRESSTSPVNGTLLSVQSSSAASLFSVNSNVKEYSSNSGAETAGGTSTTFPASTWTGLTGTTVTRHPTAGDYIATGQGSVSAVTTAVANTGIKNQLTSALSANTTYNVSFAARLLSGTFTDMNVYFSIDGTAVSTVCSAAATAITSVWSKVNCTFTTPASGITSGNAILIRQTGATARTVYVDNLSITIAADYNFATDGDVNDGTNFATNWSYTTGVGTGVVTRNTGDGYNASDSAQVAISAGAANAGLRNKLSSNPLPDTLYRITTYAKLASGSFTDFKVRYSRDGGTNYVDCVDYNTQTISTSAWTKVTCYIKTDVTTASNPYIYFAETASAARTFMVDAFSMTLRTSTTPNVQVGGGVNGGPTTLLTLDKGASAPIASDNDALLGSMYYDTSLGKLQCYEADGWGACGSSPDNVVTISPEYTNAVMHGTGIGTMTSDICSDTLNLNDGSSGQPTICGTNETYNFYKWTSPQASAQTYGIYVTYQLPSTFKEFASGQTSLMGRTDSANGTVNYQIYRSDATGLTACGSSVAVSTGVQTAWQTGTASGAADPSTCNFAPSNSIVFKINVTASNTANAYVGNLNFIFSNR